LVTEPELSNMQHLNNLFVFKRLVLVMDGLRGCPLDWNKTTT